MTRREAALNKLSDAMNRLASFGASDSEGWHALERIDDAINEGKRYPLQGRNPFQLYESVQGWQTASAELCELGHEYWQAAVIEKLGL